MNSRILYIPKEKRYGLRKKSSLHLRISLVAACCVTAVGGSVLAMHARALQIRHVLVSGASATSERDIQTEVASLLAGSYGAGLIPYRFLLAAPAQQIADGIKKKFPFIADVRVEKDFPDTLALGVKERTMFGIICNDAPRDGASSEQNTQNTECAYLDTEGIAYDKAPESTGLLIVKISTDTGHIFLGKRVIDEATARAIMNINTALPPVAGSAISGYELLGSTPRELRVKTREGVSLMLNRDDDLAHTLRVLAAVLKKEIGSRRKRLDYIDLRFGNKVFFKFK